MSRSTGSFWRTRFLDFFHLCPEWQRFPDFQRRDPERVLRELMCDDASFAELFLRLSRDFHVAWLGFQPDLHRWFRKMILEATSERRMVRASRETLAQLVAQAILKRRNELYTTPDRDEWFRRQYWAAVHEAIAEALGAPPQPPAKIAAHLVADSTPEPIDVLIEAEDAAQREAQARAFLGKLTRQQGQVFTFLLRGYAPDQVAAELGIAVEQVYVVRSSYFERAEKLGFRVPAD